MLTSRGLGTVLGDLAAMGFDARWGVLGAADVGANHQRDRIWIVAKWRGQLSHPQHDRIGRWEQQQKSIKEASRKLADTKDKGSMWGEWVMGIAKKEFAEHGRSQGDGWWDIEPDVGRMVNGMASRVDRLKAIGNGQVPLCAATAWKILGGE